MKKVIFLLLLSHCLVAQEKQTKHRYLGFGFNLSARQSAEFILNTDPFKFLRAEIRYGQQNTTVEDYYFDVNNQQQTKDLDFSYRSIRFGLFGLLPLDNMLMFGGFRYSWGKSLRQFMGYDSFNPYPYVYENSNLFNQIETVVGSEYRFFNRMALGAEIAYVFGKNDYYSTQVNSARGTAKNNYFRTTAFIRFFPF